MTCERSYHIERSIRNSNSVMTSSAGGVKGCSDHRFRVSPTYTAQLLTLHKHRTNNQYRTANQIWPTLWVSSNTQATLEQSPIQILTELNVAWLQRSHENWYFQVYKPLCQFSTCQCTIVLSHDWLPRHKRVTLRLYSPMWIVLLDSLE